MTSVRIVLLFAALATSVAARGATVVHVANADSQEISVLSLDRASGALTPIAQHVAVGRNPNWVEIVDLP